MGTWGSGTFDDDIACDWLEDLFESDPHAFFRQCLDLRGIDQLEHLACIGVVCTAEVIHARLCGPRDGLPEVVHLWVERHPHLALHSFIPDAIAGLRRVLEPESAMHMMWEDHADQYDCWCNGMRDLIRRLEVARVKQA